MKTRCKTLLIMFFLLTFLNLFIKTIIIKLFFKLKIYHKLKFKKIKKLLRELSTFKNINIDIGFFINYYGLKI
jgi:hypothetical protein